MPLEAVAINTFDAPIMRETKHDNELYERIAKLYHPAANTDIIEDSTSSANSINSINSNAHTDADNYPDNIMQIFESAFKRGGLVYVGMFNDKPIAAVGCFDDGQTNTKRLQYLAVHPENINRGIEGRFIKLVYDSEVRKGVRQFMPVDDSIHQVMSEYELLQVK